MCAPFILLKVVLQQALDAALLSSRFTAADALTSLASQGTLLRRVWGVE